MINENHEVTFVTFIFNWKRQINLPKWGRWNWIVLFCWQCCGSDHWEKCRSGSKLLLFFSGMIYINFCWTVFEKFRKKEFFNIFPFVCCSKSAFVYEYVSDRFDNMDPDAGVKKTLLSIRIRQTGVMNPGKSVLLLQSGMCTFFTSGSH